MQNFLELNKALGNQREYLERCVEVLGTKEQGGPKTLVNWLGWSSSSLGRPPSQRLLCGLCPPPSDETDLAGLGPGWSCGGLLRSGRSDDSRRPAVWEILGAPAREISEAPTTASKSGSARVPRLA